MVAIARSLLIISIAAWLEGSGPMPPEGIGAVAGLDENLRDKRPRRPTTEGSTARAWCVGKREKRNPSGVCREMNSQIWKPKRTNRATDIIKDFVDRRRRRGRALPCIQEVSSRSGGLCKNLQTLGCGIIELAAEAEFYIAEEPDAKALGNFPPICESR